MIEVGVVGYGYWGPNLVRNLHEVPGFRVAAIGDLDAARLSEARGRYPAVETTRDVAGLIAHPRLDAIVIATPVASHFDLAIAALRAGKHVLVEKPMTQTADQALRLIDEAERRRLVLAVDHTFVYTGGVRKIAQLVRAGELGDVYYYDSVRVNLGLFRHDVNVLWDLAVHDLSIMDAVLGMQPRAVSTTAMGHVAGEHENIAYVTLLFETNVIAHLHVNWLAPVKVRRTLIGGSRRMIVYDDLEPSEKVKVYDKGVTVNGEARHGRHIYQMLVGYRTGDMCAPRLDTREALAIELEEFARCIVTGERPSADSAAGWRIVRILEAATRSMQERGRTIELEPVACPV